MMILKVTRKQESILSLKNIFLEKPQGKGQIDRHRPAFLGLKMGRAQVQNKKGTRVKVRLLTSLQVFCLIRISPLQLIKCCIYDQAGNILSETDCCLNIFHARKFVLTNLVEFMAYKTIISCLFLKPLYTSIYISIFQDKIFPK